MKFQRRVRNLVIPPDPLPAHILINKGRDLGTRLSSLVPRPFFAGEVCGSKIPK